MKILYASMIAVVASQANAMCMDEELPIFAATPQSVELCVGDQCEPAKMFRQCGDMQGSSEDYEAKSVLWLFTTRQSDDGHLEYNVLHDPIDENDIPLQIVDGKPVRYRYVGVPVDRATLQKVTCVPVSDAAACKFINEVLAEMNRQ